MVMLSIWLLLLIIPLSVCDAPNIPSNDPAIPEEEYDAIKLLWEEKHREIVYHEETKRSRLKPSYNEDTSPHQLDVIDVMKLTSSHHQTSHDQDNERSRHQTDFINSDDTDSERSRRQTNSTRNATSDHDGSGSGDMRCDEPEEPVNGSIITNATTAVYLCEEGFVLLGNQYRSCNFTTWKWNGTDPTCEEIKCDDPPSPANGDIITNSTTTVYKCEEGFVLLGNQYRSCDFTTLTWNGIDPTCEVDCSYIPSVNCSDENNTMKYYYNSTTQMCQQIITCDGPGNLFNFLEECNQECPGPCVQDVPYNGSCDSRNEIYYYHIFEDRCYPSQDGCRAVRGNENSFLNLQECLGTCRRSCDGPDTEDITRLHRAAWVTSDCSTCQCTNGLVNCQPMNLTECPILYCGEDEPITLVEGCCPVCPNESCNATEQTEDIIRLHNETWTTSDCEQCQCTNGNVTCSPPNTTSPGCDPVSNCSREIVISNATMCCPVCIDTCEKNEVTYFDGESFMDGLCTCQCVGGQINCNTEMCPPCPHGTSPFNVIGQCCPECLGPCGLMSQEPEILSLFGGECSSLAPVTLNQCPEQCVKNNVVNCCIPLTAARQTDFECQFQPGFTIALKYLDTTDCNCSPCG